MYFRNKSKQIHSHFSITEHTKVSKIIKYILTQLFLISSFILVTDALCCVNFEAGEVFGALILAKLVMLLWRYFWLKYALALQL
jgi:hypothetical protein